MLKLKKKKGKPGLKSLGKIGCVRVLQLAGLVGDRETMRGGVPLDASAIRLFISLFIYLLTYLFNYHFIYLFILYKI